MPDTLRARLQDSLERAYTVERELGGGGMSRVFVAEERRFGRRVVIKVLPPELGAGLSAERFEREIALAAQLQQANIVPVLTAGEIDGLPWYSMPYVEGESLRARLGRGPVPLGEALKILGDVARALGYAHARGIVHRDIKPDNVLLSGGTAVVTDFGIAKALGAARTNGSPAPTMAALTGLGLAIGTPQYMAPEQAAADPDADHRLDVYAFGCLAYELLAGVPPFHGLAPQKLLAAHMSERARPIQQLRPDVPDALGELVARCLEKDPDARPDSAEALVRALDVASTSGSAAAVPALLLGGPAMFRRALLVYVAAFAVVAVVAKAAVVGIGLPDWVVPGALVVMALGLPMLLFTGYAQRVARHAATATPTFTPRGSPATAQHGTVAQLALRASPHLSWRRTARGGAMALGAFAFVVTAFMTLRALGIGPAGSLFATGALKEKDRVVVTDFRVVRADSTFGAVLSEAVRTGLSQSNALSIANAADVRDALRRMRRDPKLPLDLQTARDVALRVGAKAVVDGDVSAVAGGYVVTLRLASADSGRELATFHAAADDAKGLIETADRLARALRAKVGESLRSVNATPPLSDFTTSSIDALRLYTIAMRADDEQHHERAIALLREAVRIDSTFGMAWSGLGNILDLVGLRAASDSARRRAFALRDRLSEDERLWVTGAYLGFPYQRDPVQATAAWQALVDRGDSSAAMANLATMLLNHRDYAHAEPLFRASIRRHPDAVSRVNFVAVLFNQGKVREADSVFTSARAATPAFALIPQWAAELAYQRGDLHTLARIADSARTSTMPMQQTWGAYRLASLALLRGQVASYERYMREGRAVERARQTPVPAVIDSIVFAYREAWMSPEPASALARLDAALARQPLDTSIDADSHYLAAITYAMGGRVDRARAVLANYDAGAALDTVERRLDAPGRHRVLAEIALAEKRWPRAIAELRLSDSTTAGLPAGVCRICVYAPLGRAFDRAGVADSAIAFYEQYLQSPYFMRGSLQRVGALGGGDAFWAPAVVRRLGQLYEARGDRVRAADQYARFVALWNEADPEFQPLVSAARARLAQLKVEGR